MKSTSTTNIRLKPYPNISPRTVIIARQLADIKAVGRLDLFLGNVQVLVQLPVQFSLVHLILNKLPHPALVEVHAALGVVATDANVSKCHLIVDIEPGDTNPPGVDPEILEPSVVENPPAAKYLMVVNPDPVVVQDSLGPGRLVQSHHRVQLVHGPVKATAGHVVVD